MLLGPVTFLLLAKRRRRFDPLDLLPPAAGLSQILRELAAGRRRWVQIDEPCLVLDLTREAPERPSRTAYAALAMDRAAAAAGDLFRRAGRQSADRGFAAGGGRCMSTWCAAPRQLEAVLQAIPADRMLSLGVVDGRNVWRTDLGRLATLRARRCARRAPSDGRALLLACCTCRSISRWRTRLDPEIRTWLAFAVQKLAELAALARGLDEGEAAIAAELDGQRRRCGPRHARRASTTRGAGAAGAP